MKRRFVAALWASLFSLMACTDAYLFDERRSAQVSADRMVSFVGRFCTLGASEVVRPIKILIAMDASQSMRVSDPDGARARATAQLISTLPGDAEVYISVMLFAGSTTAFLTGTQSSIGGTGGSYIRVRDMTEADKLGLMNQILNFTTPDPNRDATDFVKALSEIYAEVNADIANGSRQGDVALGRYSVIFLSDGHPTFNQDDELLQGDAVVRIRQLKDIAEDVRFNTVHVFNPAQPVSSVCDFSGTAGCPMLIINQDADRLAKMAELGGGDFRDFRNNEPINFLNFRYGQVRRSYEIKDWVATNYSAPPNSPLEAADTDGDGLTDAEEDTLTTNPNLKDTDGDGFSDGVEVYFGRLGGSFNPIGFQQPDGTGLDPGCPVELRGVDADCDGIFDCDEQLVGTSSSSVDTDGDGLPDGAEWQMKTQAATDDRDKDTDVDGLSNRDEVRMHTDPALVDTSSLSVNGYRYSMTEDGPPDALGRQCYNIKVENIALANTRAYPAPGGGFIRGAGYNDLMLSFSMVPADSPSAMTSVRSVRVQTPRYPVSGIKSPVDGVIPVRPEDFVDKCGGN